MARSEAAKILLDGVADAKPQEGSDGKTDPVPTPEERAAIEQYMKRRSRLPRMRISAPQGNAATLSLDYHDQEIGAALIMQALGTGSAEFYQGLTEQLCNAVAANGKPDENAANFMLSVIEGLGPRDQMEAMLTAQMAAVHMANMRSAQRFANATSLESRDSAVRALNAFSPTDAAQMEALKRYRSTGEQKMTVEHQHVTVNEGRQLTKPRWSYLSSVRSAPTG